MWPSWVGLLAGTWLIADMLSEQWAQWAARDSCFLAVWNWTCDWTSLPLCFCMCRRGNNSHFWLRILLWGWNKVSVESYHLAPKNLMSGNIPRVNGGSSRLCSVYIPLSSTPHRKMVLFDWLVKKKKKKTQLLLLILFEVNISASGPKCACHGFCSQPEVRVGACGRLCHVLWD